MYLYLIHNQRFILCDVFTNKRPARGVLRCCAIGRLAAGGARGAVGLNADFTGLNLGVSGGLITGSDRGLTVGLICGLVAGSGRGLTMGLGCGGSCDATGIGICVGANNVGLRKDDPN